MQIYLRDKQTELVKCWTSVFRNEPDVHVSEGDIFADGPHMDCQAIISPANSYGFMDGGIDYVYSDYFGWGVQDILRRFIWSKHNGELLVGQAELVDMRDAKPVNADRVKTMSYLISAPTMRVPMLVADTANAYLAFVAALRIAKANQIESILCPGLATSIGGMKPEVCAIQMYEAYKHYDKPRYYDVFGAASVAHYSLFNPVAYFTRP